jgi:hypothetical protein
VWNSRFSVFEVVFLCRLVYGPNYDVWRHNLKFECCSLPAGRRGCAHGLAKKWNIIRLNSWMYVHLLSNPEQMCKDGTAQVNTNTLASKSYSIGKIPKNSAIRHHRVRWPRLSTMALMINRLPHRFLVVVIRDSWRVVVMLWTWSILLLFWAPSPICSWQAKL